MTVRSRGPAHGVVDVSVLCPVLNEERGLRQAVATMCAQRFEGEIEFLFMDGRSQDGTRAILEELAQSDHRIRALDNPGRTTPRGLNAGLAQARGEFVARMDAHTLYPPCYLQKGVERLRRGGVEWVSGPALPHGRGRWSRRVALALTSRLGVGAAGFRRVAQEEFEIDSGPFGVWRRELLEAHAGWDEGWPINQDAELAARVRKAGGRIVCMPELSASYVPRDSLKALGRQYLRYGQYRVKTCRRHPDSLRRSHLLPPGLAVAVVAAPLAPRPVARVARLGLAVYGMVVTVTSARLAAGRPRDALALPLVFATMHLAWGFGFIAGVARFGPPLAAIGRVVRPGGRRRDRAL
jgi:succinoglycan biosynthesis protein ExoA